MQQSTRGACLVAELLQKKRNGEAGRYSNEVTGQKAIAVYHKLLW